MRGPSSFETVLKTVRMHLSRFRMEQKDGGRGVSGGGGEGGEGGGTGEGRGGKWGGGGGNVKEDEENKRIEE